jgi:hypothetical protein
MPEKCYPCTRTILLPMYLDYTAEPSNNGMQRTRNQHVLTQDLSLAAVRARR